MSDLPESVTSAEGASCVAPAAPAERPLFMQPQAAASAAYVEGPEDPNEAPPTFDHEFELELEYDGLTDDRKSGPSEGYRERWRTVARYHAMGKSNNFIAQSMGYTASSVSLIIQRPWVRAEVERYRRLLYENDVLSTLKLLGGDAVKVIADTINGTGKNSEKLEAAKFLIEKLTGKAKQEINVESNTLSNFMEMLKQMQRDGDSLEALPGEAGASELPHARYPGAIDVTPQKELEPAGPSKWANWSKENLK